MSTALCILSGGQDSTTVLFDLKQRFDEVHAITFNYDQKHAVEIAAAIEVAKRAGVQSHYLARIDYLKSTSPLVDKSKSLETYQDFNQMVETIGNRVELTFVPMRNLAFLVAAANYAVFVGAKTIGIGVSQEDTANYPDCTGEFIGAAEDAINSALGRSLDYIIDTPLLKLSKSESVLHALTLPDCYKTLAYSHTAYSGEYPPVTQDHSTVLRAQGFRVAGVPDPLIARAVFEGKMDCPEEWSYRAVEKVHNVKGTIDYKLDKLAEEVNAA